MQRFTIIGLFTLIIASLLAPEVLAQARITRSEFVCYDKRDDARRDIRSGIDKHIVLNPTLQFSSEEGTVRNVYEQTIEVPAAWNDYNAYMHTENIGEDYTVFINGKQITQAIDRFTPTDLYISPYLDQGENTVAIVTVAEPYMSRLDEGLQQAEREKFTNCYIFAQRRLAIYDFSVRMLPDSLDRFAQLQLDVIADNSFSTDETIDIGYDIYAPDGKLMEYSVNDLALAGHSRDTLRFRPYIYHSNPNRWSAENPKLYDVMLYVKRSGMLWEYIPLSVGFAEYGYTADGDITLFGKALKLNKKEYNAAADRATTESEIKALKKRVLTRYAPTIHSHSGSTTSATTWECM
jgi:beta-galactosidase